MVFHRLLFNFHQRSTYFPAIVTNSADFPLKQNLIKELSMSAQNTAYSDFSIIKTRWVYWRYKWKPRRLLFNLPSGSWKEQIQYFKNSRQLLLITGNSKLKFQLPKDLHQFGLEDIEGVDSIYHLETKMRKLKMENMPNSACSSFYPQRSSSNPSEKLAAHSRGRYRRCGSTSFNIALGRSEVVWTSHERTIGKCKLNFVWLLGSLF